MIAAGEVLCGYNTTDLLLDVGTPERLARIEESLASGAFR
jgi:NDP-sugar pyrophosphorylase family protein